jgi:hypothetical protein
MALIDRTREPSSTELRWFGVLAASFSGLIGTLLLYQTGSWTLATWVWGAGALLATWYYTFPSAQYLILRSWTTAAFPIGWVISHAMLALAYYVVITPVGSILRLFEQDLLKLRIEHAKPTYWVPHTMPQDIGQYFKQY